MPTIRRHSEQDPQKAPFLDGASGATKKIELRDLFNYGRWKKPFTIKHLLFLFYLPFGLLLWPFRLLANVIIFVSVLILPKTIGYKIRHALKYTMGIFTTYNGLENFPKPGDKNAPRVFVSNHLSDFDPYSLFLLEPNFHILVAGHIANVPLVGKAYAKMNTIYVDPTNKDKARLDVLDSLNHSTLPLMLYPEAGLTSGKNGLMMFHKFVFGLGYSVLPIAMKIKDPWPVEVDYLGSSWFKNFFWWILVPYHRFELTFLPKQTKQTDESDSEFAARVQALIANNLGVEATNYTYAQKKELAKQLFSPNPTTIVVGGEKKH
eukprot:gene2680-3325_t